MPTWGAVLQLNIMKSWADCQFWPGGHPQWHWRREYQFSKRADRTIDCQGARNRPGERLPGVGSRSMMVIMEGSSLDEHKSMFREAVGCFVVIALVVAGAAGAFLFLYPLAKYSYHYWLGCARKRLNRNAARTAINRAAGDAKCGSTAKG